MRPDGPEQRQMMHLELTSVDKSKAEYERGGASFCFGVFSPEAD